MYPFDIGTTTIDAESVRAIQDMYGWAPQTRLEEWSSDGPSLAAATIQNFTGIVTTMHMAWKGMGGDQAIHVAEFDGAGFVRRERLEAFRSSHGPALATSAFGVAPAGGALVTGLFMAWKGEGEDEGLYFAQNPTLAGWQPFRRVDGAFSTARPALASFGGRMVLAWKGMGEDQGIYWSRFDGNSWSAVQNIPGRATSHAPALAVVGNRLYMFWKGMGDDQRIFYSWIDSASNAIWQAGREVVFNQATAQGFSLRNVYTDHHVAAAARGATLVLAWKGMRGDTGLLFTTRQPGDQDFAGEIRIPFVGSSTGPSLVEFDGRLFMAWKAIEDDRLYFSSLG
jgi:hypothetical protein